MPSVNEDSQAFVRDCLSYCPAKWQGKQLAKMLLAYVVARHLA